MQNNHYIIQDNRKHTGLLFLLLLLVFVMFFQSIIPGRYYVSTVAIILWFPAIITNFNMLGKYNRSFIVFSLLFFILSLIYYVLGVSKTNSAFFIRTFVWLFSGIVSVYAINIFSRNELKTVYVYFSIVLFAILLLFVLYGNNIILIKDDEETVGSTWMGSIIMLLSGVFLILSLNVKVIVPRLFFLFLFFLTLYVTMFVMQRATNVIFTIIEVAFVLIFSMNKRGVAWFLSLSLSGIFAFLYFSGLLINLLEWFASITTERIAIRIQSIIIALEFGDIDAGGGSFTRRSELLAISWDTFTSNISSILFGVGEHKHGNEIIGNHSFILDTLASYGIIGGVLLFLYFKKQVQIVLKYVDKRVDSVLFLQFVVVLALYIFRNFYGFLANACSVFIILIYIPLTIQVIQNYKISKKLKL